MTRQLAFRVKQGFGRRKTIKVFLVVFLRKKQDSSFSEEKEAKRLLCPVLPDVARQAKENGLAHPATQIKPGNFIPGAVRSG
jgi:hypothetical protein